MGTYFNADVGFGLVVADIEDEQPDVYGEDWADLPDFLDTDTFGDSSQDWTGTVLYLKASSMSAREGGCVPVGVFEKTDIVEAHGESDDFDRAVDWCEAHGLDWTEATWLLWASRG